MISHYDWPGGSEAMLRFGPAEGPVVVAALPPFEEANRTRAFTVSILRGLAAQRIGGALPDLPGTGESLVPVEAVRLADWRTAFTAAAATLAAEGRAVHALSIRGGALIESQTPVISRWQLSPCTGDGLLREMLRARAIAEPGLPLDFDRLDPRVDDSPVELAGNRLSRMFLAELATAEPRTGARIRVVRLGRDRGIADFRFDVAPLWRRAEPDNDRILATWLVEDIARWVHACAV